MAIEYFKSDETEICALWFRGRWCLVCVTVSRDWLVGQSRKRNVVLQYQPSSLTTSGTLSSSSRQALAMPLAMMAQLTIPPKMFTRIASTCEKPGMTALRVDTDLCKLKLKCIILAHVYFKHTQHTKNLAVLEIITDVGMLCKTKKICTFP